jgi:hypothetical protein
LSSTRARGIILKRLFNRWDLINHEDLTTESTEGTEKNLFSHNGHDGHNEKQNTEPLTTEARRHRERLKMPFGMRLFHFPIAARTFVDSNPPC